MTVAPVAYSVVSAIVITTSWTPEVGKPLGKVKVPSDELIDAPGEKLSRRDSSVESK